MAYLLDTFWTDLNRVELPLALAADRLRQVAHDILEEAHVLAHGLHPVTIEDGGILAALENLVAHFKSVYPISCRLICRTSLAIGDNSVANQLYRIVQEALANAFKHGEATLI